MTGITSQLREVSSLALGFSLAVALGLGTAGCQSCSNSTREITLDASPESGPTMPVGMLTPLSDALPSPALGAAERLSMARGKKGGEWSELQIARANDGSDRTAFELWRSDSRFLSLDAMSLLHD